MSRHNKSNTTECPICGKFGHENLYPSYSGRCITSQMFFCDNITLDNRCCTNCGFIFNAKGVRGIEEYVYNNTVWKPKPQIMSFSASAQKMTSHQRALTIFNRIAPLPKRGHVLDFGAGNGAFLECFQQAYPDWQTTAIEPGGGFTTLIKKVRLDSAHNLPYYNAPVEDLFDLVIITSVLEHTADPIDALRWIHRHLKPEGRLLMQHPNFELLPGDLFCADHINKFTIPSMHAIVRHAGFIQNAEDSSTLMLYSALTRSEEHQPLKSCFNNNLLIARRCEHIAQRTIENVDNAVRHAKSNHGKTAIFGTSPIGTMAHIILECKEKITCFIDENHHVWGHDVDGIPITGLDKLASMGVTDIALAISPLYWAQVSKKLECHPVTVHVPSLDPQMV